MDLEESVRGVIRLLFKKFQEFGSARQVVLWAQDQALQLPVIQRNNSSTCKIEWRPTAYHTVLQILGHPVYACAYVAVKMIAAPVVALRQIDKPAAHARRTGQARQSAQPHGHLAVIVAAGKSGRRFAHHQGRQSAGMQIRRAEITNSSLRSPRPPILNIVSTDQSDQMCHVPNADY
jgi:hypothetical protein